MAKKIISAAKTSIWVNFRRIYKNRKLVLTFAKRDLNAQYSQTILGIVWCILRPIAGLIIYTVFFSVLLNVTTGELPYPIFAFCGMIFWYLFSFILSRSGTSLLESQNIIKKVYFPKMVLPISKVLVALAEFGISLFVLSALMVYWNIYPDEKLLLLPIIILANVLTGLSIGIWLSALTIRFRDFHHIIPYLVNFGIFLTPIFYPATLIPEEYFYLVYFNPMAANVEFFRWALLDTKLPSVNFLYSYIPVAILLITGSIYFMKTESKIADIV